MTLLDRDAPPPQVGGLTPRQALAKRAFDLALAVGGLAALGWLIVIAALLASVDTRANGIFSHTRVGRRGRLFKVHKIRTMRSVSGTASCVTARGDPRVTRLGAVFRRTKIDELPQLWNVLVGEMSFVGPRPDVSGYADRLRGEERMILCLRPGITGPATLKYRDEELILAAVPDPQAYNDKIVFPDKVQVNLEYLRNWSLHRDIGYILDSVISLCGARSERASKRS